MNIKSDFLLVKKFRYEHLNFFVPKDLCFHDVFLTYLDFENDTNIINILEFHNKSYF